MSNIVLRDGEQQMNPYPQNVNKNGKENNARIEPTD